MSVLPMCVMTHWFCRVQYLEQTLLRYVAFCNYQLPQAALKGKFRCKSKSNILKVPTFFAPRAY